MGEVYLAEHVELGRTFVVKLLLPSLASDARLVDRLRVEARILGALQHPNVVQVFGFDVTPAGRPYLVMERLRGTTLSQHLRAHGKLPIYEAVPAVRQMLAGLQAAHELGIVHRDVKLSNVFLAELEDGQGNGVRQAKLLDFGIGKVLPGARLEAPRYPTAEGTLVGTPGYAAPEQILAETVDARTDVYAAGLVAYLLVAGRGPFDDAGDTRAVLRAHLSQAPSAPSLVCSEPLPPELDEVILKALEKRPQDRFQSAAEMRAALAEVEQALRAPVGYATTTTWDLQQLRSTRHDNAADAPRVVVSAEGTTIRPGVETAVTTPNATRQAASLTPPTLVSPGNSGVAGERRVSVEVLHGPVRSKAWLLVTTTAVCVSLVILGAWWVLG